MVRLSEIMRPETTPVTPPTPSVEEPKRPIGAEAGFPRKPVYEQVPVKEFPKLGTFQDVAGQFGTAFFNQLLGQLPEAVLRKQGYELPEPVTTPGKVAEAVGGVSGAVLGVPGKVAGITTRAAGALPKVARLALSGASAGAAVTPVTETGEILAPKRRAFQAAVGAGIGAATGLTANIARNLRNIKDPTRLSDKMRDTVIQVKRKASEKFGKAIDFLTEKYPKRTINLKDQIDIMIEEAKGQPKLKSMIRRIPKLKEMVENPELSKKLTLRESQDILNALKSKVSPAKLAGRNITPDDLPVLDFIDDVRYQQLDIFPEMQQARTDYANVLQKYNVIKKDLKVGSLINAMETRWRDPEIKKRIKQLLPADIIREMGGYRQTVRFIKNATWLGRRIAAAAIISAAVGYGVHRGRK
jgi:hypothetical protein